MPKSPDKIMNHFLIEHAPLIRRAFNQLKAAGHWHDNLGLDKEELHEHAIAGLMKAAKTWEKGSSDAKWHNYALRSIRTHMHQRIKDHDPVHRRLRVQAKKLAPQEEKPGVTESKPPETPEKS